MPKQVGALGGGEEISLGGEKSQFRESKSILHPYKIHLGECLGGEDPRSGGVRKKVGAIRGGRIFP